MERIEFGPEKEQKTLWFIGWLIVFIIVMVPLVILYLLVPPREVPKWAWTFGMLGWVVLMGLIALWIPVFYRSLQYVIDSDGVRMKKGVFWKRNVTVPFAKITNVDVTQGPLQRAFDVGIIHVQTAGAGGAQGAQAELRLVGVRDLEGLKETIMDRLRGRKPAATEPAAGSTTEISEPDKLDRIVHELTAIRQLLEKREL